MAIVEIKKTEDFARWYTKQTAKVQLQTDGRLQRILDHNYFGHSKDLDQYTSELKFNNGNRVYYTVVGDVVMILLVAGNKNSQSKDITKAKKLARRLHE